MYSIHVETRKNEKKGCISIKVTASYKRDGILKKEPLSKRRHTAKAKERRIARHYSFMLREIALHLIEQDMINNEQ